MELHEECKNCFQLHKLDCSGTVKEQELQCYLYPKEEQENK